MAVQPSLCRTWSETPEDWFAQNEANFILRSPGVARTLPLYSKIGCMIMILILILQCLVIKMGRGELVVNTSDSVSRGRGFEPHSGRRVVSLNKTYLPPKKYWEYPGRGGSVPTLLKIVYWDVKHQTKPKKKFPKCVIVWLYKRGRHPP